MKSYAMKHCTIIYDSPILVGIFSPAASGEAALLNDVYLYDLKLSVKRTAQRHGYSLDNLFWQEAATHPLRIGVICPESLADHLRDELRDQYIIELDPV